MIERRVNLERRIGERRQCVTIVTAERRRGPDRRRPFERRESAAGHIRNAIQSMEGMLDAAADLDRDHKTALQDAIRRLWLALRETDRLAAARKYLGRLVRQREAGFDSDSSPN